MRMSRLYEKMIIACFISQIVSVPKSLGDRKKQRHQILLSNGYFISPHGECPAGELFFPTLITLDICSVIRLSPEIGYF